LDTLDIKDRSVRIVPGLPEPKVVVQLKNTHLKGHLTGGLQIGKFQMFNFTNIEMMGLSLNFEFGIKREADNSAHWQLIGAS